MNISRILIIPFICFSFSGCSLNSFSVPTTTPYPSITPSPSSTYTITPTLTNTITPTKTNTPTPKPIIISVNNAKSLYPFHIYGASERGSNPPSWNSTHVTAISPLMDTYTTSGPEYIILLHNSLSEQIIAALPSHAGEYGYVKYSPNGNIIATTRIFRSVITLWDAHTGNKISDIDENTLGISPRSSIRKVLFTSDSKTMIATNNNQLFFIDIDNATLIKKITCGGIVDMALSSDEKVLVTISRYGRAGAIELRDPDNGKLIRNVKTWIKEDILHLAVAPDFQTLTTSVWINGEILIWDIAKGKILHDFIAGNVERWRMDESFGRGINMDGMEMEVTAMAYSSDGTLLVTGYDLGSFVVWDTNTTKPLYYYDSPAVYTQPESNINNIHFTKDGTQLITVSDDNTITVWKVDSQNG
jgi:WD40 repeat protein